MRAVCWSVFRPNDVGRNESGGRAACGKFQFIISSALLVSDQFFVSLYGRPLCLGLHERSDLFGLTLKIEIVPRFNDLPVFDSQNRHTGELNGLVSGCNTQRVTVMRAGHDAPGGDFVAFADCVDHLDVDIGESLRELQEERFEPCRPTKFIALVVA